MPDPKQEARVPEWHALLRNPSAPNEPPVPGVEEAGGLDVPLALMLSCAILYLVANLFPLITLDIKGISQAATLSGRFITPAVFDHT